MHCKMRTCVIVALAALVAALPIAAGGVEEGGGAAGGAMMAGQPAGGEPYVDHIWPTLGEFTAATGKQFSAFGEAPMLAALVADGKLPPVQERLPDEPLVIRPAFEIGTYGGTYNGEGGDEQTQQTMFWWSPDVSAIYPNTIASSELSNGNRTFTVKLRRGQKWSDGEDFDADDFLFYYKAVVQDEATFSNLNKKFTSGGRLATIGKVDQYTVQYNFAEPYPNIIVQIIRDRPFAPEHYLGQFHAAFSADAEKLAKEGGYETWAQSFDERFAQRDRSGSRSINLSDRDIGLPMIDPYVLVDPGVDSTLWERNPYYWKIDTAGNQLPYMDRLLSVVFSSPAEQVPVKIMAGEHDFAFHQMSLADFPVYKRNESSGNYTVNLFENGAGANALGYALNYTHKDPVLREIFNDLRFRQALSLAIDRQDMNDTLFFGKVEPYVPLAPSHWTGWEPWMATHFAEHDVERANRLLDEMGLKWDAEHEWRLRPDGKPISFEGSWPSHWIANFDDAMDMIAGYWEEVGIKLNPKHVPEALGHERAMANEVDASFWPGSGAEIQARAAYPIHLMPPFHWSHCCAMVAAPWRIWYDTNGAEGEEPPPEIKRLFDVVDQWLAAEYGSKRYEELSHEMLRLNVENLWFTGTVSAPPRIVALNNRIRNMPREGIFLLSVERPYNIDTWYIEE